jgi:hypothetical protein
LSDTGADISLLIGQLQEWRQGDAFAGVRMRHLTNRALPLSDVSRSRAIALSSATSDEVVITSEFEALVIVSQTCDVVREPNDNPFIDVGPVVRLDAQSAAEARRGRRPRYAALPGIGEDAFADLRQTMSVEKSLLLDKRKIRGLATLDDQRKFARSLARARARFAFPDAFTPSIAPLRDYMQRIASKQSPESEMESLVASIRAEPVDGTEWDSERVKVKLYFIIEDHALPPLLDEGVVTALPDSAHELCTLLVSSISQDHSDHRAATLNVGWQRLVSMWQSKATVGSTTTPTQSVEVAEAVALSASEMTVAQYLNSEQLDFDHLSTPSAGSAPQAL